MKKLIKKILREEFEYKNQLFNLLRSGESENLEMVKMISQGQGIDVNNLLTEYFNLYGPPYIKILKHFLNNKQLKYKLSAIFGSPITIIRGIYLYDENGNRLYVENSDGWWVKWEYDEYGNKIYREDSSGSWEKYEYNKKGWVIYFENSSGKIIDKRKK